MQASNICTPIGGDIGTIFVAIELSRRSWLVTVHSPDRDRFSRHNVLGGDHAGLLALIERVRERAARRLGSAPAVVSCYEAGYDGFWLHRVLVNHGVENHVLDAVKGDGGPGADSPRRLDAVYIGLLFVPIHNIFYRRWASNA